jgi:putative CocE/NonD family hydrolase
LYDPNNPVPTHGGANLILPAGPFNQQELGLRDDVLTFTTPVLDAPIEITGRVTVRLYVSSDAPDTDFTAKLVDIYPDGREILMMDSIQRVKFRNGFREADPLPPGEVGLVEIDLWSISLIVNAGHRIGLHVSSSNYPRFEVNPNTGEDFPPEDETVVMPAAQNTVYMDANRPSALLLPIRP